MQAQPVNLLTCWNEPSEDDKAANFIQLSLNCNTMFVAFYVYLIDKRMCICDIG